MSSEVRLLGSSVERQSVERAERFDAATLCGFTGEAPTQSVRQNV